MALAGCVEWTAPVMQQQRLPLSSPVVELRRDQLPGSGDLLAGGSFRFRLGRAHVCRTTATGEEPQGIAGPAVQPRLGRNRTKPPA